MSRPITCLLIPVGLSLCKMPMKTVRDSSRRRGESEEAELDESADPGGDRSRDDRREDRGSGNDEEGPTGGDGLTV